MKTIAVTIDEETLASLDRLAGAGAPGGNRSRIVRSALREHLARLQRASSEERERDIIRRNRRRLHHQAAALVREQTKK